MDLQKLFKAQRELDNRIVKEKELEGQDLLDKKILALLVELGELANEWRGFKFWSDNQKPKPMSMVIGQHPLLEEYVDCLHFLLSIGNDFKINERTNLTVRKYEKHKTTEIFNVLFGHIEALHHQAKRKANVINIYNLTFSDFVSLGSRLGFTWKEIEQAYYEKNKINHERQTDGY